MGSSTSVVMITSPRRSGEGCAGWRGGSFLPASPKPKNARSWLNRLRVAFEGILYAVKAQRSVRFVFLVSFLLLGLGFLFPLSSWERLFLFFAVMFLLFAEFVNTALELSVDLASPSYHPLAKGAKDVSAAAAFFAAVVVIVTAYGTLFRFLTPSLRQVIEWAKQLSPVVPLVIFVLTGLLAVVFARLQGEVPFGGGEVSGRAVLAFALGTLLTLVTESPQVMFFSYGLAALLTPWPQDPHRRLQILLEGAAGVSGSVLVFQIFR